VKEIMVKVCSVASHETEVPGLNEPQTKSVELSGVDNFAEQSDIVDWKTNNIRAGVLTTFQLRSGHVPPHQVKDVTLEHPVSVSTPVRTRST